MKFETLKWEKLDKVEDETLVEEIIPPQFNFIWKTYKNLDWFIKT